MKLGNVSQTVYRRSVLKQLDKEDGRAVFVPFQSEVCWGLRTEAGETVILCDVSLYGDEKDLGVFAMAQAVNHLAAKGAQEFGVSVQIMLPEFAYESRLKAMMASMQEAAEREQIHFLGAWAQSVPGIQTTIVHVAAQGILFGVSEHFSERVRPDEDIVLLKWIGLEGMLRIKRAREKQLAERFIPAFMGQIESLKMNLFSTKEASEAAAAGVSSMHQITDGGILAALWNMAEVSGIGLQVDMKKIAVRQETIEVCEYFHLNPYQLTSAGSILAVTDKGDELADTLKQKGIQAAVIGHTQKGCERVILSGGEKRYLDRPAPDELTKILVDR